MVDASASVGVVAAFIRQKLSAATDGEIDEITDRLVQMADEQELAIDQRALVSYSLLVFVCKMVSYLGNKRKLINGCRSSGKLQGLRQYAGA